MLQGVVKYEGIMGLYQGMVPAMVGSAVSWGGFFCVYENMKRQLIQYKLSNLADDTMNSPETVTTRRPEIPPSLNSLDNFMVGTLSGIVMVSKYRKHNSFFYCDFGSRPFTVRYNHCYV